MRWAEATTAAFKREAGGAAVLHLACHGIADLEEPLESGLLLAGTGSPTCRAAKASASSERRTHACGT
jgi:CHAT domain-containing protein